MKFHLYSYGQLKFWYHNNLITKVTKVSYPALML